MGPFDTLWHLLNFFAPAVGLGILASAMAKLLWRRGLAGVKGLSLVLWVTGGAALALVAGLVVFGRDGRVATYGLMVLCSGAALWWIDLMNRR